MALVTVNGFDAIETRITTPRIGAWHVDVLVAGDAPDPAPQLAGAATISVNDGALALKGTVMRSGVFADTSHVRIVAGAGGLGLSAKPKHYFGTSVRIVLGDLLSNAGEKLSSTADQSVLAIGLDAWTTGAVPVGTAISLLLAAAAPGLVWRMLPDGTLWVGRESWPDAGVDSDVYRIFEDAGETNSMRIGVDAPLQLVGTVFESRQVSATEAVVGQVGAGVEMLVWFEDGAPGTTDRLRKAFAALAQRAAARQDRVDYGRMYPAKIVSQSLSIDGTMTVDVEPDQISGRSLLPDMARVPLWLGLPGASVDATTGGRVMIGWMGGDPARPFAASVDSLNLAKTLVIAVASLDGVLFLGGQGGESAPMFETYRGAEDTYLAAIAAGTAAALSALGLTAAGTALSNATTAWQAAAPTFLSQKVKNV